MKKNNHGIISLSIFLYIVCTYFVYAQNNDPSNYPNEDIMKIYEDTHVSPEADGLGNYGNIGANPYNGKVNIGIPVYNIPFDEMNIPIELSFDTGGVRVAQEASWVGLNWSLSALFGITRQIYGLDDFNYRLAGAYEDAPISGYIYNDIDLVLNEGESRPYHTYNEILNVHHSYAVPVIEGRGARYLDTQPDVFTLNALGQNYRFILMKKGTTDIVDTYVFNNKNVEITLDLSTMSFTLIDEQGYTYHFGTKEINTTFSTIQNDGNTPPTSYDSAFGNIFATSNRQDASIIMGWYLDSVISPRGKSLMFEYGRGLHFTFPQYSFSINGGDNYIHSRSNEQRTVNAKVNHNVSTTVIENPYLTRIYGDFGEMLFVLESRKDLSTGSTINYLSNNYYGNNVLFTSESQIRSCHGSGQSCSNSTPLLPWKLSAITVKNIEGEQILDVSFGHSYFNAQKENSQDKERFLRLKLDSVNVNDKTYKFEYLSPNSLAAKDSDGIDFWGFDNGKDTENEGKVPRIGRFVTEQLLDNGITYLGHSFLNVSGANRSSDFNYGKNGLLVSIEFPTGGKTYLEYEPNDVVLNATPQFQVEEFFPNSSRYRWTNHRNEANFNATYEYLKCSKDPNYSYFTKEDPLTQGDATISHHSMFNVFEVLFPSVLQMDAILDTQTGWDGMSYWGGQATVVLEEINTGQEYTLFNYSDAPSHMDEDSKNVSYSLSLPPGDYVVVRRYATVPAGEDYSNYPPIPAVSVNWHDIILYSYDNATPDLSSLIEKFEVGGARVKRIINKDVNGAFVNGKIYSYDYPDGYAGLESSGILMDDLIFYSKTSGFFSYSPRIGNTMFTDYNTVGGHSSAQGSHIGYSFVSESQIDNAGNMLGRIERRYHNIKNEYFTTSFDLPYGYDQIQGSGDNYIRILGIKTKWFCSGLDFGNDCAGSTTWVSSHGNVSIQNTIVLGLPLRLSYGYVNGNVTNEKIYDANGNLLKNRLYEYTSLNGNLPSLYFSSFKSYPLDFAESAQNPLEVVSNIYMTSEGPWGTNHSTYFPYKFPIHHGLVSKISSVQTYDYLASKVISTEDIYSYNSQTHHPISISYVDSKGIENRSVFYYPYDVEVSTLPGMSNLIAENRLANPVRTENFLDDTILFTKQIQYANDANTSYITAPVMVLAGKGQIDPIVNPMEAQYEYEKYSPGGKVIQVRKANGIPITLIWGYNEEQLVARIENATLSEIESLDGFGANFSLGNGGLNSTQLNSLRSNLPEAMVTTYSYRPGIGLTSKTDPRGNTTSYEYDNYNRLKNIKDYNGNILEDYQYHYKN